MPYQHLLIAVDFSDASALVAARALDLAQQYRPRLTLLHVVDYLPPLGIGDDFTPAPVVLMDEEELIQRGKGSLEKLARQRGLSAAERMVLVGSPRQEIVRLARERGVDLIVLGSHGRHGLGRLLGSTARAVLNDASCDVLAVRIP